MRDRCEEERKTREKTWNIKEKTLSHMQSNKSCKSVKAIIKLNTECAWYVRIYHPWQHVKKIHPHYLHVRLPACLKDRHCSKGSRAHSSVGQAISRTMGVDGVDVEAVLVYSTQDESCSNVALLREINECVNKGMNNQESLGLL